MTTSIQQQHPSNSQNMAPANGGAAPVNTLKLGVRYLHPKFREVILESPLMIDGHPSSDSFYAVLNCGEGRLVSAYNLGPESPNQSKPCVGCGKVTEPLDFHPHRRKCKNCVRAENRERKRDLRRTAMFFQMMRLKEVLSNIQMVVKSSPGAEGRMLALAEKNLSRSEFDKAMDEIIATPGA
jgi:hypothetical protein